MKKEQKTYLKATINIITAIVAFFMIIWIVPKVIIFFIPFIIGYVISLIAAPLVRFFEDKIKIRRKAGSAVVIILVLGVVILVVYALLYFIVQQLIGFAKDFPQMWAAMGVEISNAGSKLDGLMDRLPSDFRHNVYDVIDILKEYLSGLFTADKATGGALSTVGNIVNSIPDIIMGIVMALLSSYFFVAEKETVTNFSNKYIPGAIRYRLDMIKNSIAKAFGGYFKAQFKIEVWIYLITTIGLLILKVRYAFLIALIIAFFDFLPVFGAGTIMVPWAIVDLFDGHFVTGVGLLVVWGVGQLIRQLIQPKIVGDSIGVAPIPTLFLLYIGFKLGGVFGMIIAVPIGIIIINLYEEGVFMTTLKSFKILFAGFNRYRQIRKEDEEIIEKYISELPEDYRGDKQ